MEKIIPIDPTKRKKVSNENKNTQIENLDLLSNNDIKNKKRNTKKIQKPVKKTTGLKDLLNEINEKKATRTNQIISGQNSNEKNDIINFSRISKKKVREAAESGFNEFRESNISSKFEKNPTDNNNFPEKTMIVENEQFNNINDNKKNSFSVFDYYCGYDKFLNEASNSTINNSTSSNFIKKAKIEENCSTKIENNYSNNNINSFVNNTSRINDKRFKLNLVKNLKNYGGTQELLTNTKYRNYSIYNKYNINYNINFNHNYFYITGDWQCGNCGNYNYSFRDFCNRCNHPKL